MIFDGRPLDEIPDDEIAGLVEAHVSERQHLEFKATFDYKNDDARLELLRDVVSMANGGGGYLIFGVRDDGHGRAQCFAETAFMSNSDSMLKSIRDLCHVHISEHIEGIEIGERDVKGSTVILVRVPVSGRRPHMVTLGDRTSFWTRAEAGKRAMSLGEIREAFLNNPTGRRLDRIDASLSHVVQILTRDKSKKELRDASRAGVSDALLREADGRVLADFMLERFEIEVGKNPYFWLAATPTKPRQGFLALDEPKIASILSAPPASRRDGWNMGGLYHSRQRSLTGLALGLKDDTYLQVFENGHIEFRTPLNDRFCRMQSEEERRLRPRLYPYPVVEYPVSFLHLVAALFHHADYADDTLIQLQYRNAAGYILRPGQPDEIGFLFPPHSSTPFVGPHLVLGPMPVPVTFNPDDVAFSLLKGVYRAFEVDPKRIPFRDSTGTFSFE
ncbi:helix-turn-helix domain-containing protein [Candidatus Palauibacter sp.]|uniref:AlbA family DNA-binding domain-containing protein n=1 Tax=Candidatus Palauibacter sp. TaxID=3101350 RepID=UPI003B023EC2